MEPEGSGVLRSKRDATKYRILVCIAERQPAVNQREIADAIGVTAQAVSDYLQELVEQGYVDKQGRGRYEVTKEGVDWLITRTDELREFVAHVSEDVIEAVEVDTALATAPIEEGQAVSLSMADGVLRAAPGTEGATTAVAVTAAGAGEDVGVTDFEGLLDYELGRVTVVSVPPVQRGGSRAVDATDLRERAGAHDRLAVSGVEAVAAAAAADLDPDLRFGTPQGVREAAMTGLDVLLLAVTDDVAAHTDALREQNIGYEVIEPEPG
ncbi:MAG: MarR family transcriptional regulator [Halobacteriaceae archaeon]